MVVEHKTMELYGKMVFERAIVKTPFSIANPMRNEACFVFIRKGTGMAYSEAEFTSANAREGLMMKCGSFFSKMVSDEEDGLYEAIAVHFYPEVLRKVYENKLPTFLQPELEMPEVPSMKLEPDHLFDKFFEGVLYYFSHPELVNEELITLKLKEVLLLLENTSESAKLRQILSHLFSPKTYSFKSIINAHVFSNLSLSELSEISGMSLSAFKRKFKEVFDESPGRYIKSKRLEKAADLLKIKDYSISEVAYQCAFNDIAAFSTSFKQEFGKSPSDFRNQF